MNQICTWAPEAISSGLRANETQIESTRAGGACFASFSETSAPPRASCAASPSTGSANVALERSVEALERSVEALESSVEALESSEEELDSSIRRASRIGSASVSRIAAGTIQVGGPDS